MRSGLAAQLCVSVLIVGGIISTARAANYFESSSGDLSGNGAAPTPLSLFHGSNILSATSGGGDFDMLAITIPASHRLDTLALSNYTGSSQSFAGIQTGNMWTAGTGFSVNAAALLGWTHFGPAASGAGVGQDILDNMAMGQGSAGFTPPLGPGVYTLLFQDTGGAVTYTMRFNVTFTMENIPGDFNVDTVVDGADLLQWQADFGVASTSDADNDGDSDGNDFLLWQQHLGQGAFASAVPEPAAAAMAAFGAAVFTARARFLGGKRAAAYIG